MPDFHSTRKEIRNLANQLDRQRKNRSAGVHATRRLEQQLADSVRRKDQEAARTLDASIRTKKQSVAGLRLENTNLRSTLEDARQAYLPFSDPREFMGRWQDDVPVLLFPLRLETRFRTVGEGDDTRFQLWVRAYPDSCLIDTFADLPSETEYQRIKAFWIARFRNGQTEPTAGDEVNQFVKKGLIDAWRRLQSQGSAGRAYWLTQNLTPTDGQAPSVRLHPDDIFLVIPTEGAGPGPAEQAALVDYYTASWRAQKDPQLLEAALQTFITTIGDQETAEKLLSRYAPAGLPDDDPRQAEATQRVEVTFLNFPAEADVDRTVSAWSDPAKVSLLPDRLLLQGWQNGKKVLDEIGPLIHQPLTIGPDPGDDIDEVLREAYPELYLDGEEPEEDRKAAAYIDYLKSRSDTKWLFDFEEAQRVGMGFVVDLDPAVYRGGFDRLFVTGLRLSSDAGESKEELEGLLHNHQFGVAGLSFLPQGTPTNAMGREETPEESFERFSGAQEAEAGGSDERLDGQWFSDLLGIDADSSGLRTARNFTGTDQLESLATQRVLYPATMGYFLESMLDTVTTDWERTVTKEFFRNHVSPRGRMPLLRITDQPYAVLPITGRQKGNWLNPRFDDTSNNGFQVPGISDHAPVLTDMLGHLNIIRNDWEEKIGEVAHLWKPGDPHQNSLDVLGLHAGSVEWDQRMGETTKQFTNRLKLEGIWQLLLGAVIGGAYLVRSKELFEAHGIDLDALTDPNNDVSVEMPRIMDLLFFGKINPLGGPLIDDRPLSEAEKIRSYTPDNKNYLEWLADAMLNEPGRLRSQAGFSDGDRPRALLFQLLRHATDLQAANTGLELYRSADLITNNEAFQLRRDLDFVGVEARANNSVESRYDLLYREEPQITNATAAGVRVIDHLGSLLRSPLADRTDWRAHLVALQRLANVPTARLERLLAEHLDSCNYRLDAWLQGFTDLQLRAMRYGTVLDNQDGEDWRDGIYLGAYGWLEDLRPDNEVQTPATLNEDQQRVFTPNPGDPVPTINSQNGGYIHAPSLDHATTAAVLRNAYLGNAAPDDPDRYAINLSSERVRMGLQIVEGMRNGQELGALLGYQLERGLHDSTLELDEFIYDFRTAFPLVANRLGDTKLEEGEFDAVEQIAAANVIDGLLLVEKVNTGTSYPWGVTGLPAAGSAEGLAIQKEVDRMVNMEDAAADLALAESVHQTVKGNFDRAAGNLNAYSKGGVPPVPEVARTPRKGNQLTHRFALHLDPGAIAAGSPLAIAEPAIAAWLDDLLPAPDQIAVSVDIIRPSGTSTTTVRLSQLGWTATDFLYQLDRASDQQFGNLDEAIQRFVHDDNNLGPTVKVIINYTTPVAPMASCFELLPLVEDARQILLAVRSLRPSDLRRSSEAREEEDLSVILDTAPYDNTKTSLENAINDLTAQFTTPLTNAGVTLEKLEDMNTDPVFTAVKDNIDAWVKLYGGLVERLQSYRPLNAHTDLAYSGKHGVSNLQKELATKFRDELQVLLNEADDLLTQAGTAPTPEEEIAFLKQVEPLVSTTFTTETDPAVFNADVTSRRGTFASYVTSLTMFIDKEHTTLGAQIDELIVLADPVTLAALTTRTLDISEVRSRALVLAQDLFRAATELTEKAAVLIGQGEALARATPAEVLKACRFLLGEDYQVLPRFQLREDAFNELSNAYSVRDSLLDYQRNDIGEPFPVDTWLNGLARVRPFLGHWERLQLYSEDYPGAKELDCVPLQLPLLDNDSWLGLEFPATYELDEERLLYSAHYARTGGPASNLFCGLLIDEWTEVIPVREEDTGLAFNFDQPATEPAQAWLLALPSEFTGSWNWEDLLACLHEGLDLARLRAVEPKTFEDTAYSHLLPTTVSTVTTRNVTTQLNYAAVNGVLLNTNLTDASN
ncbi:MAG: hypothetical protein AB8H12_16125 [Lewinella sp.]